MTFIGVRASLLAVGMNQMDVMDAPMGRAEDRVWGTTFWYRGSAAPGALSATLIAGHINDPRGRNAVFAHIDRLRAGDTVVVRETRTRLEIRYSVTNSKTYSLEQASDPAVLSKMYGTGPVAGLAAQPSADGLAHLSLVTCAGRFKNGTHDQRLVVYAVQLLNGWSPLPFLSSGWR